MTEGFLVKVRGAGGLTVRDYLCEEHGRSEHLVERPAPEVIACPACGEPAELVISAPAVHTQFVVSATQGKSSPPPHPNAMNLMKLGEGQSRKEWRAERKAIREQERKRRVMERFR